VHPCAPLVKPADTAIPTGIKRPKEICLSDAAVLGWGWGMV
jgi:hypothetical protein